MKKKNNDNIVALKWIYCQTKKYTHWIIILCLLSVIVSVSFVALALVSKDVIDIATGHSDNTLIHSGILLFSIVAVQIICTALRSITHARVSGKMTISIKQSLFSKIVRKKYRYISAHHSGDLLNRFTSDTDVIINSTVSIIPNVASMIAKIFAGVGTLFFLNPTFASIVVFLGIIVPFIGRLVNKRFKYLHKECQKTEGQVKSFLQECFANIVVIKSFVSELPILNKLNEYMTKNYKMKMKRNNVSVFASLSLYSFFTIGYYLVLLWGATNIAAGTITYGTLTAFLQLISQLKAPLENVSGIMPQYYSAIASAERLMELENIDNEPSQLSDSNLKSLITDFNIISLNNISFAYDNEMILQNCFFDFQKNKITAITGESGSGKSTLFKIILGLYEPDSGNITVDNNTVIDSSTRGLFAYVPQGNMILSGTIKENITLCNDNIPLDRVIDAAKAAVIYDYIISLPNGFETPLSERGAGLSEGQIQRLAIARALLFDAPILLFDESTSALDEETETQLLANIKAMKNKTVLFITHRNTSISVCDSIIHVENKKFIKMK